MSRADPSVAKLVFVENARAQFNPANMNESPLLQFAQAG
jgi:hypothetical protein